VAGTLFATAATAAQDVKRPEEVFEYDVDVEDNTVIVKWDIEDGYYLYRDKMAFAIDHPDVKLGPPQFPQGEIHSDEFFGEQVVFRDAAVVTIPVISKPEGVRRVDLLIESQGCADFGLCYPPQEWKAGIKLARAPVIDLRAPVLGAIDTGAPLPIEEAFKAEVTVTDPFTLEVRWFIEPGYYLYRHSFSFDAPGYELQFGAPDIEPGVMVDDLEYGMTEVYYNEAVMRLPLSRGSREAQMVEIQLGFQGCKQDSICYPPEFVTTWVDLPEASADDFSAFEAPVSEQARLAGVVADASITTLMLIFLGAGLLLSFTPCCLPMVPILSGIIAGQGDNVGTLRAFWLSLCYVLGMAFTYTIAGAIFGAAGTQIQAALQTPLVIGTVSVLFIALALAMFGAYELQIPAALQTRLTAIGNNQKAGSYVGTAIMGAVSALVVSTCVAPPLVAALTVIAQTGDVTRGALALFAMAIGMGIPLLIIGTSAGKLLPKAGPWMNTIKAAFGFMMLALAVWMLSRLLPGNITMGLYAAVTIAAAIRFGAFSGLPKPAPVTAIIGKLASIILLIYGGTLVVGLISGSTNPLQPLDRISGAPKVQHLEFEYIKSVDDFEAARQRAKAAQKHLMLDFYADWCVSCKEMEYYTFTDKRVQDALAGAILVQADVTANDEVDKALLAHFGIFGPPTIVYFDRDGREIKGQRTIGYVPADDYLAHLDYVLR
jgi:thiol:disulfide interchange protein DsbD